MGRGLMQEWSSVVSVSRTSMELNSAWKIVTPVRLRFSITMRELSRSRKLSGSEIR
jgi:hypothetical protein